MIVVPLMGGLGNQMFQYAFGRGMSEALGRRLVLDLTMLPTGEALHARPYELGRMPLHESVRIVGRFGHSAMRSQPRPTVTRLGRGIRRRLRRWTLREPREDVKVNAKDLPRGLAVCVGYWQSPKYFDFIAEDIRRELNPGVLPGSRVDSLLAETQGLKRIAVHVRRGDYATVSEVRAVHGVLSVDYYEHAVEQILRRSTGRTTVVVLSEDSEWCAQNLKFDARTVYAEADEPLSASEALALMSRCEYHVIANSSLSWWGAWLAGTSSLQVIYPTRWFAERPVSSDYRFPDTWKPSALV